MKTLVKIFLISILWSNVGYAKTILDIKYPLKASDYEKKTAYLYRLQEELRLLHNQMGADFKNGVITEQEWQAFLDEVFEPKQAAIVAEILEARQFFKGDTKYNTDLEKDFEEKIP